MASTPKTTLDDGLIDGLVCAICGEDALHVVHMDNLPDYVGCESCKSAFLSEDGGERVFYGQIDKAYPLTERFALKQWVWLEAVEKRAGEERSTSEEEAPTSAEPQLREITPLETDIDSPETPISETADDILETPKSVDLLEERLGKLDLGLGVAAIPGASDSEQDPPEKISEETDDLASYFRSITPDEATDVEPSLPAEESPPTVESWGELGLEPADEPALPEIADAQSEEGHREPGASWGQPIKQETPEVDEIPLPDWAQPEEGSVEPSLEEYAQKIETPIDNLLSPDETEQDFLSNLRQSAGVPLESEPIPDLHISEVPLESQPIFPQQTDADAVESEGEPESFASRIESLVQIPPTDLEPIEKMQSKREVPSQERAAVDAEVVPEEEVVLLDTDPLPGHRHRVVIRGEKAVFPGGDCAHCGRTPVKGHLAVMGSLPDGQNITQRKPTTFNIPLCSECRKRAGQLSDEAKEARLQAHLLSGIGGMLLVVGALVLGIIKPADLQVFDILILAILLIVGYTGPALFLLGRVGKYPPPASAAYIRSTLLIPQETQGLETAFEWRNGEYAERFFEANEAHTLGKLSRIKDRAAPPRDIN